MSNAVDFASLLKHYGYLIVYLGGVFEGEPVALLGGYAARAQGLSLPLVMLCSMLGVFTSDQFCFYSGRFFGKALLRWRPGLALRIAPFTGMIDRHRTKLTLTFQYVPGAGAVVPVALGMTSMPALRYLWLDVISSAVWAVLITTLGYGFGTAAESLLGRLQGVIGCLVAVVVLVVFFLAKRRLAHAMKAAANDPS